MKIAPTITFCLGIMICQSSHAQITNKTTDAQKRAGEVRHINLKTDYGFGHVLLSEQSTLYLVQLPVGGSSSEKHSPPDVSNLDLQVWLLKTDGTSIPQHGKSGLISIGSFGWDTYYLIYDFDKVPSNELAGIVVRAKGKLFCEEIKTEEPHP